METTVLNKEWLIASEVELIYKSKVKASQRPQITSSYSAYQIALKAWDSNKIELLEQFKVLMLSNNNKVLGVLEVSSGGITGTIVDLRIIFSALLKSHATAFLIIHNHPSGKLAPSDADRQITKKIKEASKILDITLLDHLIITAESYYSFVDEGIL
ncbi:JAB domain-containing protein [Myroides odoratimimus]|uniref:DNA repair protein n=1 Tax=Myroides odoratimimus TaxID=76832 RepID=A0AAI8C6F2_9FLAO|nr:JAB domain-containing protein [Myroides odoratimimus]ALU24696.1 DNA repair protein [Myroides odoratimimus]ALU26857.1 DNA repair protein [Myroides odoratimimus]MDM1037177.1 JAB domain-containing protein [Myroides odoratimimus]MDM1051191.1 JAB domain-containing protein [Myroides odoratimimus]